MISNPVEGVKVDAREHPAGKAGAKISLDETAERAWKARMDPRLRAWATQVMHDAGVSKGTRVAKAKAILEAFRKKVPYVADPVMGEFMATPAQNLCLDEGGLCFKGGDCDDQALTLAAVMMTLGIPAMIVGSSHRAPVDTPSHVYMAFEDEHGEWIRMDGTTDLPVGRHAPAVREWWVEPGEKAKEKGVGDFVGMSGVGEGTLSGIKNLAVKAAAGPPNIRYPNIR